MDGSTASSASPGVGLKNLNLALHPVASFGCAPAECSAWLLVLSTPPPPHQAPTTAPLSPVLQLGQGRGVQAAEVW